jgi:hypothetical protein
MPLYIDTKYINLVSPRLERFHWKKTSLAVCRCPVCGDSSKNKSKVRFYFYEKSGEFFVRCHNCDYSTTIGGFLKRIDSNLYRQYCFETLKDKNDKGFTKKEEPKKKPKAVLPENKVLNEIPSLAELPSTHPAVIWAASRQLPKDRMELLYYAENFSNWISNIDPDVSVGDDERIVIPIFSRTGALVGAQGRLLTSKPTSRDIRYITIKADKDGGRLWYGLERINTNEPIVVVEGPIDSMFLRNGVAMLGLSDPLNVPSGLPVDNLVYALDNEPRNVQVIEAMHSLIDAGRTVCVWGIRVNGIKDINDMIKKGFKAGEIESMIRECSHSGLSAKLAVGKWKRV